MKRKRYQVFDAGRVGSGKVDIESGGFDFEHQDILDFVPISHIYARYRKKA
jgi:hypothetical protein